MYMCTQVCKSCQEYQEQASYQRGPEGRSSARVPGRDPATQVRAGQEKEEGRQEKGTEEGHI